MATAKKAKQAEKTPEELQKDFADWKLQKESEILALYRNREKLGLDAMNEQKKPEKNTEKLAKINAKRAGVEEKIGVMEQAIEQGENRLNRKLLRLVDLGASRDAKGARKERTRKLIELGGLVVKSGMADLGNEAILGCLTLAMQSAAQNSDKVQQWALKGKELFASSLKGKSRE